MPPYSSVDSSDGVALVTSGDVEKPEVKQEAEAQGSDDAGAVEIDSAEHRFPSKTSLAGEADSVPHRNTSEVSRETIASIETNENNVLVETETSPGKSSSNDNFRLSVQNGASEGSLSREKDAALHGNTNEAQASNRDTSQVSVSSNKEKSSEQDHDQRKGSMTVNEFFNAPSEASLSDNTTTVSRSNNNAVQDSNRDTSLSSTKGMASGHDESQRKVSLTVSGSSQQNALPATTETEHPDEPNKIVKEETVSEKDTSPDKNIEIAESADPVSTRRDSSMSTDTDPDRICTVTANVKIGCIEHLSGHKTVTLTGSVYRLPREDDSTTPKPGDKIGIVKGDVTSSPADNETSEKLAILRGDLFAVSGEAAANGLIATASIDVLSCSLREKLATITADVAPSDDPEHQSGVISGEVLAASERGSYDDKIGSLSGKVVALTFGEGVTSLASANS